MAFLDFFKRFSKPDVEVKELSLLEVDEYIDSWCKETLSDLTKKLEEIKLLVGEEKKKAYENSQVLLTAELKNPNIPERAKHIMEGNRKMYVQRFNRLLETISLPENLNKLSDFCDYFDTPLNDFAKDTMKSYQILNEFFGSEVNYLSGNIKALSKLMRKMKEMIEESKILEADELKKRTVRIQRSIYFAKEIKEKINLLKELVVERNKAVNKEEGSLKILEDGKAYEQFTRVVNQKKAVFEEREHLEKELLQDFSVILPALKKYERMTLDQELVRGYLDNSLQVLLSDQELKIVELLIKMNNSITDRGLELKDKKRDKILQELIKLDKDYFKNFIERYKGFTSEINTLLLKQENMTIIKEIEEQKKIVQQKKNELDSTNNNLKNLGVELRRINVEQSKNNLAKEIRTVMNREVRIS